MSIQIKKPLKPGGFREFIAIAYPLVVSNASMTLMNFVDRLFLSWSSPEEIAAAVPAGILFFTVIAFFLGISEYTNTFVAQFYGAGRSKEIGCAAWQGIIISLVSGVFCFLFYPLGGAVIDLFGHPSRIAGLEKVYFGWCLLGAPFFIVNSALSSFYSGRGKTKVIMAVNMAANLFNAVLDYALIFGAWGFPCWGIKGAAIATSISQGLATLLYFMLFLSRANHETYNTRAMRIHLPLMKSLLRYGAPVGMQFMLDVGSFTAFVALIGRLGNIELAASNIVLSINMLAFFPMMGASIATSALVGQYIGRKDLITAEKSAYTSLYSVEAYMLFFAVIYICFPTPLMKLFQSDYANTEIPFDQIVKYGAKTLLLVGLYQISDAMNITFNGALRGAGDTAFAMWASVFCAWLFFVPGTWAIVSLTHWGVLGAWLWATVYLTLLGLIYMLRFRSGKWKSIRMISDKANAD